MASHAGLILVFKNKDGYIDEKGKIVKDKEQARWVTFYEAGFSDAKSVLRKLGLDSDEIDKDSLKLETLIPSYDSRLADLEGYFRELGHDYRSACYKAEEMFTRYGLADYDRFLKYEKELRNVVFSYIEGNQGIELDLGDKKETFYKVNWAHRFGREGYEVDKFYSADRDAYRYRLKLKQLDLGKYFNLSDDTQYSRFNQNEGLVEYVKQIIEEWFKAETDTFDYSIREKDGYLEVYSGKLSFDFIDYINERIRDFYSKREMHITRMFGSYVLLQKVDDELKAVLATNVPIQYCPLMVKLLREVGGETADELISAIRNSKGDTGKMMCHLIDEVVIKGGYFDTSRPLNSCEANVTFGASETIASGFKNNMLDAAVIVSNNLGTIITTNDVGTQGAVKRMTGLFYTSPSKELVETAKKEGIIVVNPYTAEIDQVAGVKEAIKRGYKRIAVTLAAQDNALLEELGKLEKDGVTIYKFGLCSTGIDLETAKKMEKHADIVWTCASKYVKEYIEDKAIAQVGIKIPVHIMTSQGWKLVKNHLTMMDGNVNLDDVVLETGDDKAVIVNSKEGVKKLVKRNVRECSDCPHPCI